MYLSQFDAIKQPSYGDQKRVVMIGLLQYTQASASIAHAKLLHWKCEDAEVERNARE